MVRGEIVDFVLTGSIPVCHPESKIMSAKRKFVPDHINLHAPFDDGSWYSPEELYENLETLKKQTQSCIEDHKDCKNFNIWYEICSGDDYITSDLTIRFERPETDQEMNKRLKQKAKVDKKVEEYERKQYLKLKEKFGGKL